ncbi:hypothetical protein M5689_020427 [Euphorbia peplus]|nr:hypothetical protein M5689_020427 [Euphorbia peplus]
MQRPIQSISEILFHFWKDENDNKINQKHDHVAVNSSLPIFKPPEKPLQSNDSLLCSADLHLPSPHIKIYNVLDNPFSTGDSLAKFLNAAPEILTRKIEMAVEESGIKITCILNDADAFQ